MMNKILSFSLLIIFAISCQVEQELQEIPNNVPIFDRMVAVIHPTENVDNEDFFGTVVFTREGDDVRVMATVSGLEPNSRHGFHIHEYGDCSATDATSAGGHFDPFGMPHGAPTDTERHMGDLGNIVADDDGIATLDYLDPVIDLDIPFTILGRGIVVHAGEDDFQSQPTGAAGERLGCGVIGVGQSVELMN